MYHLPYKPSEPLDENMMLFYSDPDFSGNCLSFWEYVKKNTSYKIVWFVYNNDRVSKLRELGIECYYINDYENCSRFFCKAKYVICERVSRHRYPKPEGQIDVQLMSISHFIADLFSVQADDNPYDKIYVFSKLRSTYTDFFIANSEFGRINTSAIHFADPRKIYVTGSPRYDPMLNEDGKTILLSMFPELAKFTRFIIYCPSPCKSNGFEADSFFVPNIYNLPDLVNNNLEALLYEYNAAVIFKPHPADEASLYGKNLKLPRYHYQFDTLSFMGKSIYHVLNAFDIMITDTSQLANEFLLLDRPILFNRCTYERRLSLVKPIINNDMVVAPGAKHSNAEEFLTDMREALQQIDIYSEVRKAACDFHHKFKCGNASERVLSMIEKTSTFNDIEHDIFMKSSTSQHVKTQAELQLESILKSNSYRFMKKTIKILCPEGSIRRSFCTRMAKIFT